MIVWRGGVNRLVGSWRRRRVAPLGERSPECAILPLCRARPPCRAAAGLRAAPLSSQGPAMGDMWRSQKMQLVQMIVQNDAAHAVVSKLGDLGKLEFRDVRPAFSVARTPTPPPLHPLSRPSAPRLPPLLLFGRPQRRRTPPCPPLPAAQRGHVLLQAELRGRGAQVRRPPAHPPQHRGGARGARLPAAPSAAVNLCAGVPTA